MTTRSGYKSAEDDQFMIFSSGAYLQYPAFEKASNGFVRGPKGERLGRGWEAEEAGANACLDYINKYIETFSKFDHTFVGVTANLEIKLTWTRTCSTWQWVDRAPGYITIAAKCYFADHPDAFDVYVFNRPVSYGSGSVSIQKVTQGYRIPDSFDADGKLTKYRIHSDFTYTEYESTDEVSQRESFQTFLDKINDYETMISTEYVRVEWSHDLDEFRTKAAEYLDAKDTVDQITQILPQLAALYQELGYRVNTVSSDDSLGDRVNTLKIKTDEHTITLTPNSARILCHYERDEEKLVTLRKLRLEDELRNSVEKHGDIRDLEEKDQ